MDHPLVSVIMAVHNAEDTLKESLASVLGQTFADFEVIIIDDGSSDRTGDLLQQVAAQDSRVKVFTQGQRGLTN
ncbi:MAG TPA: glycosyltransferase, partial [Acidobacteria bacterium]|nr:glycosyltransferase [Acidobacteriota bacterium]